MSQVLSALFNILLASTLLGNVGVSAHQKRGSKPFHWVDTWTSMPQLTEPANLPPAPYNGSSGVFVDATIRQTLQMSVGADKIRLRLSNVFGVNDLPITAVTIAKPFNGTAGQRAILANTIKQVSFSGSSSIIIPNGALAVSDPIDFHVDPQSVISVTIYTREGQQGFSITSHPGSRTTSFFAAGNQVNAANLTDSSVASAAHWYFLSAVEAWAPSKVRALAVVGDSITDGRGSQTDQNNRWTNLLSARMQKNGYTKNIAVVNQAAGGNRILYDGLGPNAQGRIDRDVLAHSGVEYAMIFEGVNDIGTTATNVEAQDRLYQRLILAYKQIATRVHAAGIPIFAATITPFGAPNSTLQAYSHPTRETTRLRINDWIRTSKTFDAVIDFDKILRDPKNATQLNAAYSSGDYLHPSVAGYQKIADSFPLEIFQKFEDGVDGYN
ncbi:SubName: Full=Uncharacterized protein {ECO:0000313/EMBL:CCA73699.1} [Serendipita indica DSM 11827]|nr:SubName: Full=Uncharacterized protein {ECO:0000313/EMBL:CCA73699.1} [Serendipita indica DSM 11827]